MMHILSLVAQHGGGGGHQAVHTWPLGFGLIPLSIKAGGALALVAIIVGVISLIIHAGKKSGDESSEEESWG